MRLQEVTGDFPGGLKDLRTDLPEVRQALIDVFAYWIEAIDIDGFRIDTVKHVEHDFWLQFGTAMRDYATAIGKENFFMFGEVFDGADWLLGSYTEPGMLDSVFYFSQKFQVYDAVFKYGAPTSGIESLWREREVNYSQEGSPNGPTDVDGNPISPTDMLVNFIDNHDVPRFLFDEPDIGVLHNALNLLFTQDGIPCLYYGTEQQFSGGTTPATASRSGRRASTRPTRPTSTSRGSPRCGGHTVSSRWATWRCTGRRRGRATSRTRASSRSSVAIAETARWSS